MTKFCRNCGKVLSDPTDKTCPHCNTNAAKASFFCRYCGRPTNPQDLVCTSCGAAVKPTPNSIKLLNPDKIKLMRLGKAINLSLVVLMVAAYAVFVMPKSVKKPVTQAASDAVMASTGYTALPLDHIEITPPRIPQLAVVMFDPQPSVIAVNSTRQITVYAVYRNASSENGTKAVRLVDITNNCTYQSSNENVALCSTTGLVLTTGTGTANITAFYTAAPGSANFSNAAAGRILQTFTAGVGVYVR